MPDPSDQIADAVILPDPEDGPTTSADITLPEPEAAVATEPTEAPVTDPVEDTAPEISAEVEKDPAPTPMPDPAPAPVILRKGGFVPLLLGGVAAAAIGFAVARTEFGGFLTTTPAVDAQAFADLATAFDTQASRIGRAEADLAGLRETLAAPSPDAEALTALQAALDGLADNLAGFDTRITALEQRPAAAGTDAGPELAALRDALAAQSAEIEALSSAASAQEQAAMLSAQGAMARAALSMVQAALDSGAPFSAALADLADAGVAVPAELAALAEGAPTMAALQAEFPDLARTALATARSATPEAASGLGGFLRGQLGVRSLEPREGNDPDAILSRAEAAMRAGHLSDATAELDALPETARAVLAGWSARAAQRQAAVDATETLRQTLIAN